MDGLYENVVDPAVPAGTPGLIAGLVGGWRHSYCADDNGGTGTGSASLVVDNLVPLLSISAPESGALYTLNTTVDLSVTLADPFSYDTLSCSIDWDDTNGWLSTRTDRTPSSRVTV